jgi:hypothetical protein
MFYIMKCCYFMKTFTIYFIFDYFQVILKKTFTAAPKIISNDPADTMSLNGILDNISCESLSNPHSPKLALNRLPQGV